MKRIVRHSVVLGAFAILSSLSFPAFADSSSTVDLEFTFASSLTTTLSSADIFIHDITPGTSKNSNSVNLNVTTNNISGYVVSASTGDANNNSSDLIQTGITDKFSSIAASANLESLTTDDTWGYSTKVDTTFGNGTSEQTIHTEGTWSNLNGLATTSAPIYSTNSPLIADVNFRIAARASEDIEPGEYTNTINFFVVANPAPVTFSDAFAGAGKTKLNNYYKMQDMSATICNTVTEGTESQLIDTRDNKVYWVLKAKDNHCWMTQNLDHNIVTTVGYYTHDNTDLGWGSDTTTTTWTPTRATIPTTDISNTGTISSWTNDFNTPYSVDTGDWYWTDTWYASTENNYLDIKNNGAGDKFSQTPYPGNGTHGHVGNYYNWSAAIASNDTSSYIASTYNDITSNPQNSICPAGWRLPTIYNSATDSKNEYRYLLDQYGAYVTSGSERDKASTAAPLYFVRGGYISSGGLSDSGYGGRYWSSTVDSGNVAYYMNFDSGGSGGVYSTIGSRRSGLSLRCIARDGGAPGTFNRAFSDANKTKATASDGKQYYQMQDMTTSICSAVTTPTAADYSDTPEVQLVDNRDGKIYWVAKLKDGHCWMTQNLDHDIVTTVGYYTHDNTDLGWGSDKTTTTWTPARATIPTADISRTGSISGWTHDYNTPYSVDTGDWYWTDTWDTSTTNNYLNIDDSGAGDKFSQTPYPGNGTHGHVGNYYNWSAAVASNDTSSYTTSTYSDISNNPQNSICPAGWRLPTISNQGNVDGSTSEFSRLNGLYGNSTSTDQYITASPLYYVRGGYINGGSLSTSGWNGYYWSSTVYTNDLAISLYFRSDSVSPPSATSRYLGQPLRCIAR